MVCTSCKNLCNVLNHSHVINWKLDQIVLISWSESGRGEEGVGCSYLGRVMHQSIPAVPNQLPPLAPGLLRGICPLCHPPGMGHLQILPHPGTGHLPTPGPTPTFWHACSFLSEYNYTEDFTGKTSRLAHLSRTGKNWRNWQRHVLNFMHAFLHCLSSHSKIGSYRSESTLLNQISVDIIWRGWRTSFHIYKTIHNS